MADYSEQKQHATHRAGFGDGPFFKNPLTPQKMRFVDAVPSEVAAANSYSRKGGSTPGKTYSARK